MKHRPSKLPHKSGGRRPRWAMTAVWTKSSFSLWGRRGLVRKVEQRLNRQDRVARREARLPAMTRLMKQLRRIVGR